MPETFRGFQLAGKLFLLTSLFIEPTDHEREFYLGSQKLPFELLYPLVNCLPVDDYRLKAGRILWRLKVALRLKPPDALPAESRLKAWWAQ